MRDDMHAPFNDDEPNEELRDAMPDDGDAETRERSSEGDVKFDRWLAEAAREYNQPPTSAPRNEMWAVIAASTAASIAVSAGASRPRTETPITPFAAPTPRRSTRVWQMAAAAVLLLGSGIVIGTRLGQSPSSHSAVPAASPSVAPLANSAPNAALPSDTPAGPTRDGGALRDSNGNPKGQLALNGRAGVRDDASYALATVDHLSRAEALLTSFKGSHSDSTDASLERWAQDLLADTRLLLDSPAAQDSRRRHLLEDLELVLAQIVQLRAESSADKSIVRKSIERGEVLTRIRTTIPAGSASGV